MKDVIIDYYEHGKVPFWIITGKDELEMIEECYSSVEEATRVANDAGYNIVETIWGEE